MSALPSDIYRLCRKVLLDCREFESYRALRAVFVTDELRPFRIGLREADNPVALIDLNLEYLLEQRLKGGQSVFPIFLAALRDRYEPGDALREELGGLIARMQAIMPPPSGKPAEYQPIHKDISGLPTSSLARIYDSRRNVVGIGFLVGEQHIFTCAHLLSQALQVPDEIAHLPATVVQIDFPFISLKLVSAHVKLWDPNSDIAILELNTSPEDVQPIRLIESEELRGHTFRAFGFPEGFESGVWAAGVLSAKNADGWLQIEGNEVGYRIQPGFSGSPVWDEKLGGVVGMVTAVDKDAAKKAAFLIPASKLTQAWVTLSLRRTEKIESKPPSRRLKVFLCHASGDKRAVRDLYSRLIADRFAPWFDEENLLPGQKWQQEIPKAVRSSDVIVICLSSKSITKAGYIQKEIKYALDIADEKPEDVIFLIPVRLEECEVPERLQEFHWVNLFEEKGYDRLKSSLFVCAKNLGIET